MHWRGHKLALSTANSECLDQLATALIGLACIGFYKRCSCLPFHANFHIHILLTFHGLFVRPTILNLISNFPQYSDLADSVFIGRYSCLLSTLYTYTPWQVSLWYLTLYRLLKCGQATLQLLVHHFATTSTPELLSTLVASSITQVVPSLVTSTRMEW